MDKKGNRTDDRYHARYQNWEGSAKDLPVGYKVYLPYINYRASKITFHSGVRSQRVVVVGF